MKEIKIALVHDYIKEYGGAERVLEVFHEIYPHAPIFTLVYCPSFLGPHAKRFASFDIHTSIANRLPFKHKFISPLRLFAPLLFKEFDFSSFDVVIISATGAYSPNMIIKKNARQICFTHTPPRYLYGYATAREWKNNLFFRFIGELINHFLRIVDFISAQQVDLFIANSYEVKGRIKKYYRKEALVVYPPIESPVYANNTRHKRDYFLAGGRLARPKHIDLIIQVCMQLNLSLKVFGRTFAGYGEELQKYKGVTIEFLGEVPDEEKWELMKNAKAYICAAEDEDFGILPVEVMSAGTPVIAYRSGGVKETVIEGKTGIFFDNLTQESLIDAIQKFNTVTFIKNDCIHQAQKFSKENFIKQIRLLVKEQYNKKHKKI